MRNQALGVIAGCAALLLAACSTVRPPSDDAAALKSITAFNTRYLQAINDGDAAALGRLTNADHLMLAPNGPPISGKAANEAANARTYERFRIDESWVPLETVVAADLAYQRGTFTVVATPKSGGASHTTHGNFLRIYRRQPDGSWWMTRDMFNAN